MVNRSEFDFETAVSDKLIISHGPIMVYSTKNNDKIDYKDKFVIVHGWTPLLLSTAACFTQLHCYFELPVCAPVIYRLIVNRVEVKIFTKSTPRVVKLEDDTCSVQENQQSPQNGGKSALVNIFMADMSKFDETVELHANTKMVIYADVINEVVLKAGGRLIIEK